MIQIFHYLNTRIFQSSQGRGTHYEAVQFTLPTRLHPGSHPILNLPIFKKLKEENFLCLCPSLSPFRWYSVWRPGHRRGVVHPLAGDHSISPCYQLPHATLGLWRGQGKQTEFDVKKITLQTSQSTSRTLTHLTQQLFPLFFGPPCRPGLRWLSLHLHHPH